MSKTEYIVALTEMHAGRAAKAVGWREIRVGHYRKPDGTIVEYVDRPAVCGGLEHGTKVWVAPSFGKRGDFDEFWREVGYMRTFDTHGAWAPRESAQGVQGAAG